MPSPMNPIVDIYQTQLEASRRLADVMFAGTQRIDRVMIDTAHRAVTEQLNFVQAVAAARDPGSFAELHSTYLSRRPDNAMNCQRELFRVMVEIQSEFGKSAQYYLEQLGGAMLPGRQAATAATADDGTANPVSGMFDVWQSAFREATAMASRNMDALRANAERAASGLRDGASGVAAQAEEAVAAGSDAAADAMAAGLEESAAAAREGRSRRH